jgi:glycosyltransferase involved in cell wall biosynthesis
VKKENIIIIIATNKVPQRTKLIIKRLQSTKKVLALCWARKYTSNINDLPAIEFRARGIFSFAIRMCIWLVRSQYDRVIVSDFRILPLVILVSKFKKAIIIYDRLEIPTVVAAEKICNATKIRHDNLLLLFERIEAWYCKYVDTILTPPVELGVLAEEHSDKICILRNVPDPSIETEPYEIIEADNCEYMIYAGTISKNMGLKQYLDLTKRLNDHPGIVMRLLLIGQLWGITEGELAEMIEKKELLDFVVYRSWVSYERVLSVIEKGKVGLALLDPQYEKFKFLKTGASRKIFTYMLCGVPVISGEIGGDIVRKEKCGIVVDYNDVEAIYRSTEALLRDGSARRMMGENGRQAVLEKYNWQIESRKLDEIFQRYDGGIGIGTRQ